MKLNTYYKYDLCVSGLCVGEAEAVLHVEFQSFQMQSSQICDVLQLINFDL